MLGSELLVVRSLPGFYLLLLPDADFTVVEASDDFLRAVGVDRQSVISRGVGDVLSRVITDSHRTPLAQIVRHTLNRVVATRREERSSSKRFDPRLSTAESGEGDYWEATHRPVLSPEGKVVYIVTLLERGRTGTRDTRRADERPHDGTPDTTAADARTHGPADNELLATDILESITEGFFGLDREWRFTYVNHEAQHILGRPAADLVGRDIWIEYPGLFDSPFEASYRAAMDKREPASMTAFYPDHDCYYDVHTYPAPHGISVYFRNVTDRIRAEEKREQAQREIREQAERLRELDQAKDRFLATLSHELRNPLAPLRTAAEILGALTLGDERLDWARQVILRQTRQMGALLDDLLNAARITQGKLELRRELVNLEDIVNASLESARPLIEGKSHQLSVTLPKTPVALDGDPLRLSQVLTNLLLNAAKYTDPGGSIALTAEIDTDELVLTVQDNGIGIPDWAQQSIFTMFAQVEGAGTRTEGGLGIGLALARHLLDLHEGSIAVASDGPGHGSKFTVRLPLASPDAGERPCRTPSLSPKEVARSSILIADDNRDAADTLAMLLRLSGHDVCVAYGGEEALRLAAERLPAFVLLDIGMPDVDGHEVARRVRREPWSAEMTLIALTGFGQEEDKLRATDAGFDFHLTKPIDPKDVDAILARTHVTDPVSR